jgi:hypothetical protein
VYGRREDVELLFPFTSPIPNVADWSVDGIINHAKLENMQLMVCYYGNYDCAFTISSVPLTAPCSILAVCKQKRIVCHTL